MTGESEILLNMEGGDISCSKPPFPLRVVDRVAPRIRNITTLLPCLQCALQRGQECLHVWGIMGQIGGEVGSQAINLHNPRGNKHMLIAFGGGGCPQGNQKGCPATPRNRNVGKIMHLISGVEKFTRQANVCTLSAPTMGNKAGRQLLASQHLALGQQTESWVPAAAGHQGTRKRRSCEGAVQEKPAAPVPGTDPSPPPPPPSPTSHPH